MTHSMYRRAVAATLLVALLFALLVAVVRVRVEKHARQVEITMDYSDFNALARSYAYDTTAFLVALRRAGLTSLAVSEELGANVNLSRDAMLFSGQALIDAVRLSPPADASVAALVRSGSVSPDAVYLLAYTPRALQRYRTQARLHLGAHAVKQLTNRAPYVLQLHTEVDYFSGVALGLPESALDVARKTGLLLSPRIQNDERLGPAQIDAIFDQVLAHNRVSTMIFFGLRNQVLGYPDHLDATAEAFKRTKIAFGSIESYARDQEQKGNDGLATRIINQTVRVQAIGKPELEKITDLQTVIARYLLGVRERNVRVVYVRPWAHQDGDRTIEATNVEMIQRIADGLRSSGYSLRRASPIPFFKAATNPAIVALVSLAVPAMLLLLLDAFGYRRLWLAAVLILGDLALYAAGLAVHHEFAVRKLLALAGALVFASAAFVALAPVFTAPAARTFGQAFRRGLRALLIAVGVALCGALVVVGLLSHPLFMDEIDRFSGVKAILLVPPLIALLIYTFSGRFGARNADAAALALEPVRMIHLAAGVVVLAAAALVYMRSGNQSDIAPSALELHLRSGLSALLLVRPRFKEFALGFPLLMLIPALRVEHRRAVGWLLALAVSIGLADIIDTFSHLHTGLLVSLLRIVNGAVIGIAVGALLIWAYRAAARERPVRS